MAPKLRGMLLEILNVFEIVAILLLIILPNFTRNSIIDFTRSSFLSIGLSHHRRQIGTTSALPLHYVWMFWLERAMSLSLLIYYHWTRNFTAIVLGFYLMSTLCSSSIAQELPKNPNLRNTNKGKSTLQLVGDTALRLMFWLDRVVGVVSIFFIPRFASFSTVLFYISDFVYLIILGLRFYAVGSFPRGGEKGLQPEKEARLIQDDPPKEKVEVHDGQVENKSWEGELVGKYGFVEHVPEYTFNKSKGTNNSEIKEAPKEESSMRPREEDLVKVVEAQKEENKSFDEGWEFNRKPWQYFFDYMPCSEGSTESETSEESLLDEEVEEIKRMRAENERLKIEKEALEDKLKVERLDHEDTRLALEKRNQILEDKLKVERLEHEDTRLEWEAKIQAINAMLLEENLKSQALSEEIDDHSEFEKQMVEMIKTYNEDCKRLELENKDIAAKLKDVTAAIGKDQQDLLDCQEILCKCKEECKVWESENIALKIELEAANSWYQYYYEMAMTASSWNQYYMESENSYRHCIDQWQQAATSTEYHHQNCLHGYDLYVQSLVEEIDHLSSHLLEYKEYIAEYKEKCRTLEEEQDNLHAKLCSTIASCELYRNMLQDLASS